MKRYYILLVTIFFVFNPAVAYEHQGARPCFYFELTPLQQKEVDIQDAKLKNTKFETNQYGEVQPKTGACGKAICPNGYELKVNGSVGNSCKLIND